MEQHREKAARAPRGGRGRGARDAGGGGSIPGGFGMER